VIEELILADVGICALQRQIESVREGYCVGTISRRRRVMRTDYVMIRVHSASQIFGGHSTPSIFSSFRFRKQRANATEIEKVMTPVDLRHDALYLIGVHAPASHGDNG